MVNIGLIVHKEISMDNKKNNSSSDKLLWNRKTDKSSRRGFLKSSGLLAMATAIGVSISFSKNMPAGLISAAFAQTDEPFAISGK